MAIYTYKNFDITTQSFIKFCLKILKPFLTWCFISCQFSPCVLHMAIRKKQTN